MKNKIGILLIIGIFFTFSACIDIVQEIKLNPNKSGNICFSINLGVLGSSFMNVAKDYVDLSLMEDIKKQPFISAKVIENTKGISNISPVCDNNKGFYALSFDFDNQKALNDAFYKIFNSNKNVFLPKVFKISKRSIKVTNLAPVVRYFTKKYEKEMKDNKLLSIVSFKQLFILPAGVKKVKNPKSEINDYKVNMSCTLEELLNTKINIGNKIWF